jgi:hypothetical protein
MARIKLWLIALAAVVALLWRFMSGRPYWQGEAEEARERLAEALRGKTAADQAAREARADEELADKRGRSAADRLRGALDRARERRTGGG